MSEEDLVEVALWLVVRMDLMWLIMSAKETHVAVRCGG